MTRRVVIWRRLDAPGHEICELAPVAAGDGGWNLAGVALVTHAGQPYRLDYEITCDDAWTTRRARVRGHRGGRPLSLDVERGGDGAWLVNDAPAPALHGCVDVDLGFSPATNLLPIRREQLALGAAADVRAAWVRFPELSVEVLEQRYTRLGPSTYLYESAGGAFRRELLVSDDGLVLDYPGLWIAEGTAAT